MVCIFRNGTGVTAKPFHGFRTAASYTCKHSSPILSIVPGAIPLPSILIKRIWVAVLVILYIPCMGQVTTDIAHDPDTACLPPDFFPDKPSKKRIALVAGAHAALWAGSYIALNEAWYADYPKSSFHFFNDNKEWNQVDKAGHVWTTYQVSRLSTALWRWSGCNRRTSTWLGGLSGIAYQSIIEIQDGFSSEWGFSWGDMAANITGAALFVSQQLSWHEQRIVIKMSYWPYDYNTPDLLNRRNQLFGKSTAERLLKDYNSQTFWISANLQSLLRESQLPSWLNIAAGYKSEGMFGGFENKWTDKEGNPFDRTDIPRVRRFFIAPDIDLTRIRTNSKWVRSLLSVLNTIKIPAPALELNSRGKLRAHALFF